MEQETNEHLVVAHRELLAFLNTSAGSDFIMADAVKILEQVDNVLAGIRKRQQEEQLVIHAILAG